MEDGKLMQELAQELAAADAQVIDTIMGRDITRGDLGRAFDRVRALEHWKNPIDRVVTIENDFDMEVIRRAIVFFTGSTAEFIAQGRNRYRVVAAGYFAVIGA